MKWLALVLCLASTAIVQPVRADDPRANALLERGASLRERGRLEDALDAFMHADAIESTPRSIAQIGLTHGALEHWVQAYDYLRRALLADDDAWIRSRWRSLEAAMLDVRAHVGFIHISGARDGVHVLIGERDLGPLPITEAVAAMPGSVEVEVRRGDELLFTQRLTLTPGEVEEVTIQAEATPAETPMASSAPAPVADPLPAPAQPSSASANPWPVIGWSSIGVGGALIVGGVIFHVMREHEAGLANDCRTNPAMCMGTAEEHVDAAATNRTLAIIGYAAGGALVAGGIIALVLGSSAHTRDDSSAAHLVCAPSFTSIGASCVGSF